MSLIAENIVFCLFAHERACHIPWQINTRADRVCVNIILFSVTDVVYILCNHTLWNSPMHNFPAFIKDTKPFLMNVLNWFYSSLQCLNNWKIWYELLIWNKTILIIRKKITWYKTVSLKCSNSCSAGCNLFTLGPDECMMCHFYWPWVISVYHFSFVPSFAAKTNTPG